MMASTIFDKLDELTDKLKGDPPDDECPQRPDSDGASYNAS
jgi:hypothetical protein